MNAMLTTCLNCRATAMLTIAEALAWDATHGPGKCEPPQDELCGLDACEIAGFCQARSGCEHLSHSSEITP
jgi:hypothetical protein